MALKDLTNYYDAVKQNYAKMTSMLAQYEGMGVPNDKYFKRFEKKVKSIQASYETLAYFFMLWSKPSKEEAAKADRWEKKHGEAYDYLSKRANLTTLKRQKRLLDDIEAYVASVTEKKGENPDGGENGQ